MNNFRTLCFGIVAAGVLSGGALADGQPVQATLVVSPVSSGEVDVVLTLSIEKGWHIYGSSPGLTDRQPLRLKLKIPDAARYAGPWIWPEPDTQFQGQTVEQYEGVQVFRRRLTLDAVSGEAVVRATVSFQACTEEYCAMPETIDVTAKLRVVEGRALLSAP